MIPTQMGGVDLRRSRDHEKIKLHCEGGGRQPRKIEKNWLAPFKRGGDGKTEDYRLSVKQAMLIASSKIDMEDLAIVRIDPVTKTFRTKEQVDRKQKELLKTLTTMREGTAAIPRKRLATGENVAKQQRRLKKHLLAKRTKKCSTLRKVFFDIEGGRLHTYKTDTYHAKATKTYELKNAKVKFEHVRMPEVENSSGEPFLKGKDFRVVLSCSNERPQGPLYLYPDEDGNSEAAAKQAKNWERAVKMSKYLQLQSEKEVIETVVRTVTGNVMKKGWDVLFVYANEIKTTKELVKQFSMRLMQVDTSRGWHKARLVYRKKKADMQMKDDQKAYVARFLAQRMTSISKQETVPVKYESDWKAKLKAEMARQNIKLDLVHVSDKDGKTIENWFKDNKDVKKDQFPLQARYGIMQAARPEKAIRNQVFTSIQQKFKHFRQEKIFDRNYALQGSQVTSRSAQAKKGTTMDCAFTSQMNDECLAMTLNLSAEDKSKGALIKLKSKKLTYSETTVQLNRSQVSVPDGASFLVFAEVEDNAEHQHLATSSFPSFVNLDQISSCVLHSERMMAKVDDQGAHHLSPNMAQGCWMTIRGPRVCWGRRIHPYQDPQTNEMVKEVMGAEDGLACGRALASGASVKMLSLSVTVNSASIPKVTKLVKNGETPAKKEDEINSNASPGESQSDVFETHMILTFAGRSFKSGSQTGEFPKYSGTFKADVAIADEKALDGLDHTEVGVEIIESQQKRSKCLWAGKIELWKIFAPDSPSAHMMEGVRHLRGRLEHLRNKGIDEEATDSLVPLSKTLKDGSGKANKKINLYHPNDTIGEQWKSGSIELGFSASVSESSAAVPLSPELQGCGLVTALYTTHRGCWYNKNATSGAKFNTDSCGNFLELKIDALVFPDKDKPDGSKLFKYHLEVASNGTKVCTKPLTRPKANWNKVYPCDPQRVIYNGKKLYVPLPPGCWSQKDPPKVQMKVVKSAVAEGSTLTFAQLKGRPRNATPSGEVMYTATVSLEGMAPDQQRGASTTLILSAASESKESEPKPGLGDYGAATDACIVHAGVFIRDRDYIRMSMAEKGEDKLALCVGDMAMLACEEPLIYPATELEFRHRCFPGDYDASKSKRGGKEGLELRDPSMSHEYAMSGLKGVDPPNNYPFRQKYIPANADDVVPYKYVLPKTEIEFEKAGKAGTWWRIMTKLADDEANKKEETPRFARDRKVVVTELTHTNKSIPVTILATYASKGPGMPALCDVEISPSFVNEWEKNPERQYTVPGQVHVQEFQDTSEVWLNAQTKRFPAGTGDVGDLGKFRRRVILKEVPISFLNAVHSASFNVYDAMFSTTEEAMAAEPGQIRDSLFFNPRDSEQTLDPVGKQVQKRGGFAVMAGPVPADAGAAATYEWSLHLRCNSEDDMYHFVTMLRHCVRMDFYQQQQKVHDYKQKNSKIGQMRYHMGAPVTSATGYLEVVLMEARRLKPKQVQAHKDIKSRIAKSLEPEMNPQVTFRMYNVGEPILLKAEMDRRANNVGKKYMLNGETVCVQFDAGLQFPEGKEAPVFKIEITYEPIKNSKVIFTYFKENSGKGTDEKIPFDTTLPKDFRTNLKIDFTKFGDQIRTLRNDKEYEIGMPGITSVRVLSPDNQPMDAVAKIMILPQTELVYRGSRTQVAPQILNTTSPNWAKREEYKSTGGFLFKTPPIDPQSMTSAYFELEVQNKGLAAQVSNQSGIGTVRVPVTGKMMPEGGAPLINFCDGKQPFNNLWLPLSDVDKNTNGLHFKESGEVHIMTRWVVAQQTQMQKRLPKSARAWFEQELRPKLMSSSLREPGYNLQMRTTYNPNTAKELEHPLQRFQLIGQHAEELLNSERYAACLEGRQAESWREIFAAEPKHPVCDEADQAMFGKLAWYRLKQGIDKVYSIDDKLRRGIPPGWRMADVPAKTGKATPGVWLQITRAHEAMEDCVKQVGGSGNLENYPWLVYKALLKSASDSCFKSDAKLQIQEDYVKAAAWETSLYPNVRDVHLNRLRRAKNIVQALVTFSYDSASGSQQPVQLESPDQKTPAAKGRMVNVTVANYQAHGGSGAGAVAYCESLLTIAFFLVLPQEDDSKEGRKLHSSISGMFSRSMLKSQSTLPVGSNAYADSLKSADKECQEESKVFWLLYTLIGSPKNGAFRDYYGVHLDTSTGSPIIANYAGVTQDLFDLDSCLSRYQRDLWIHLKGLGFNLSTVFHGAFMRLYAFYLPTATLFRFWDLLFSETTKEDGQKVSDANRKKPSRHVLIDLAYAALKYLKSVLLQCNSVLEIQDAVIGFLEALYDPDQMVELTAEAERELWERPESLMGIKPEHQTDIDMNMNYYKQFLLQFKMQNKVLWDLTRETRINIQGRQQQGGGQAQATQEQLTTKNVVNYVIYPIRNLFKQEDKEGPNVNTGGNTKFGMWRKSPQVICELGPPLDAGVVGQLTWGLKAMQSKIFGGQFTNMIERVVHEEDISRPQAYTMAKVPNLEGEPAKLDKSNWMRRVEQAGLGSPKAWSYGDCVGRIYDTFESLSERTISLNEFFVALVCCSKGTVGEKALALFHLFSFYDRPHRLKHIVPVSHAAKAVVEKVEGNQEREKGYSFTPPVDEDISKTTALHFKIYTNASGQDMLLGEAFVQTLNPFIFKGMGQDAPMDLTIWGTRMQMAPGHVPVGVKDSGKVRLYYGELKIGIKWMPSEEQPEKGQVGIHVHSIRFDPTRVEAPHLKNPWIQVDTYDEAGNPKPIPRWDPRNFFRKVGAVVTAGYNYSGAYGDHIEFAETMKKTAGVLYHKWGQGDHGWKEMEKNKGQGRWVWNQQYGDQYSVKDFVFKKDFCVNASSLKPNTISIQSCRMITLAMLRRSLHFITNRSAMLIADEAFSRSGAVPAILDAVIISGQTPSSDFKTPRDLIESYTKSGKSYCDVKQQLMIEAEKQCNKFMGILNLWDASKDHGKVTLSEMNIKDPYPMHSKLLWIRYARAGDGERFQARIPVSMGGDLDMKYLEDNPIKLDMEDTGNFKAHAQMTINKEEFVSCLLNNHMLAESLRQISSSDMSKPKTSDPINLRVFIADPSQTYEDDDLFDAMNVRQRVLLEIWDKDNSYDDFLGECWLPPLGTIGSVPKQFVLPVGNADPSNTRPQSGGRKDVVPGKPCTGDLVVQASWKLPADDPDPVMEGGEEDLKSRVKREEQLHTGKLYLKIVRAEGLRSADLIRKNADPYVCAYVQNEAEDPNEGFDWKKSQATGIHEPIFKTRVFRNSVNPVWDQESGDIKLKTGAFEKRTRKKWGLHQISITQRGRKDKEDQELMKVISGGQDEVKLSFADPIKPDSDFKPDEKGSRHKVKIYLSDTIREFKMKVMEACYLEAAICSAQKDEVEAQKYRAVALGFKHQVTVFVPSEKLRSLAQQNRPNAAEYKRLYRLEEADPSYWSPLDPIKTFQHYQSTYAFGASNQAQRLKINEGTEDYKIRNYRYRQFLQDMEGWFKVPSDINTEQQCFGWGVYTHENDGGSTEWRPCLVDRPEGGGASQNFKVDWLYTPKLEAAEAGPGADKIRDDKELLQEKQILLAPHVPKILGSGHFEHQEFLSKAKGLHDKGMSDADIAKQLNAELQKKFEKSKETESEGPGKKSSEPPPPITPAEVSHYLKTSGASEAGGRSGVTTPRSEKSEPTPSLQDVASTSPPPSYSQASTRPQPAPMPAPAAAPTPSVSSGTGRPPTSTGPPPSSSGPAPSTTGYPGPAPSPPGPSGPNISGAMRTGGPGGPQGPGGAMRG
mmetsp:Transcript_80667/g.152431  ORF Transcript_80667/g.152431 Transcript_80667/m.152431 type:complete len:3749 (-) Transcript_80667:216-11462(-)